MSGWPPPGAQDSLPPLVTTGLLGGPHKPWTPDPHLIHGPGTWRTSRACCLLSRAELLRRADEGFAPRGGRTTHVQKLPWVRNSGQLTSRGLLTPRAWPCPGRGLDLMLLRPCRQRPPHPEGTEVHPVFPGDPALCPCQGPVSLRHIRLHPCSAIPFPPTARENGGGALELRGLRPRRSPILLPPRGPWMSPSPESPDFLHVFLP